MAPSTRARVSALELKDRLAEDNLCIVDLRAPEAYTAGHIPGARPLTPKMLNSSTPPIGGLLPSLEGVNDIVKTIGLSEGQTVVAYDAGLETAAARLIWVLDAYGYQDSLWLDGGMAVWESHGLPTSTDAVAIPTTPLRLQRIAKNVIETEELITRINDPSLAILDVRSQKEYAGQDVRSARGGHIPGAAHMEWTTVFGEDKALRPVEQLLRDFADIGVTPDKEVIVYCQTHQRSAVTYVLLKELGFEHVRAIDGAWSNWGNRTDTPIQS